MISFFATLFPVEPAVRTFRNINNIDLNLFNLDLESLPFHHILRMANVNEKLLIFFNELVVGTTI